MEILFFIVGIPVFGSGVLIFFDHLLFVKRATVTTGIIKGYKKVKGSKGSFYYYPIVQVYTIPDGEFTSSYGSSALQYKLGEEVKVLYQEEKEPRIKSRVPYVIGSVIMIIGGIFIGVFWHLFQFNMWSVSIATIIIGYGAFKLFRMLGKAGIQNVDDIKEKYRELKSYKESGISFHSRSAGPENNEGELISTPEQIDQETAVYRKSNKVAAPLCTLIGIAAVAGAIYLGMEKYEFLQVAQPAQGEVVDLESQSSDGGYVYYPIVEYSPQSSYDVIRFKHDSGSSPPGYSVGERVDVLYHPKDLENAIIDSGIFIWLAPALLGFIGMLFGGVGVSMLTAIIRRV